jgi:hypothetical protein
MNNLLFDLTDSNGNRWAGKRLDGNVWLIRMSGIVDAWITVKILSEQEVEEYQKACGCYVRA